MPTWAIILIVFMVLLSTESIIKGYYNVRTIRILSEYSTELEKRQTIAIREGLLKAEELFDELKETGEFRNGETFILSDCVFASIHEKKTGIYLDVHVEKTIVTWKDFRIKTEAEKQLNASRLLRTEE